ncbi:MAG: hypothetical protein JST85_22795 [Acidobacteria bacterium]|nr:hypothetical protein [Acidobacteriota bacterium]
MRAETFSRLTFDSALREVGATVFRTTVLAFAFPLSALLTALAADTTRLVIFLLAAVLGDVLLVVVLCNAFATGLDAFAAAFFDTTTFDVALAPVCAADLGFAVVRNLDFGVEGGFGFDKVFPLDFVNFVA